MAEKTYDDALAACPFYRSANRERREIVCESSNVAAAVQGMRFADAAAFRQQLEIFCNDVRTCRRCEQFRAVVALRYAGEEPF